MKNTVKEKNESEVKFTDGISGEKENLPTRMVPIDRKRLAWLPRSGLVLQMVIS